MTRARNRAKNPEKENLPSKLTPQQFIQEFIKKQNELLLATVQCIKNGEIELTGVQYADDVIDAIVEEWCEFLEPEVPVHLKMNAAVFMWALLDQLEEDDVIGEVEQDENVQGASNENAHPGFVVAVEILKTVRSIWGKDLKNG